MDWTAGGRVTKAEYGGGKEGPRSEGYLEDSIQGASQVGRGWNARPRSAAVGATLTEAGPAWGRWQKVGMESKL